LGGNCRSTSLFLRRHLARLARRLPDQRVRLGDVRHRDRHVEVAGEQFGIDLVGAAEQHAGHARADLERRGRQPPRHVAPQVLRAPQETLRHVDAVVAELDRLAARVDQEQRAR
jgi:hypothetical protein